jgi:hypothetical protein
MNNMVFICKEYSFLVFYFSTFMFKPVFFAFGLFYGSVLERGDIFCTKYMYIYPPIGWTSRFYYRHSIPCSRFEFLGLCMESTRCFYFIHFVCTYLDKIECWKESYYKYKQWSYIDGRRYIGTHINIAKPEKSV